MVAWEVLIGLLGIATSIFFGLNGLTRRITTKSDILAMLFAFSRAMNDRRTITLDDLREGYTVAKQLFTRRD
jgi:hypothetical protein